VKDLYKDLNLDRSWSLSEINRKLDEAEHDPSNANLSVPDMVEKTSRISQARKVFATAESRKEYDVQLFGAEDEEDPDEKRIKRAFELKDTALKFINQHQYDVAYQAIQEMVALVHRDDSKAASIYSMAAMMSALCSQYDSALKYANEALLISPDMPLSYYAQGYVYFYARNKRSEWVTGKDAVNKSLADFYRAATMSKDSGDMEFYVTCYEKIAFVYYYFTQEKQKAYEAATTALDNGSTDKDTKDIKEKIEQEYAAAEAERRRRQAEAEEEAERRRRQAEEEAAARKERQKYLAYYAGSWIVSIFFLFSQNFIGVGIGLIAIYYISPHIAPDPDSSEYLFYLPFVFGFAMGITMLISGIGFIPWLVLLGLRLFAWGYARQKNNGK